MKNVLFACLIIMNAIFFDFFCQAQKENIKIDEVPIFSESDSFTSINGYVQHNKFDYFIIEGNIKNKINLRSEIDSFVNRNSSIKEKFDNYIMFFYLAKEDFNKKELNKVPYKERYKIFLNNKYRFLISTYSFYNSRLVLIDYDPKFEIDKSQ